MIWAAVLLVVVFVATWAFSRRLDNYSFVDVTWAFAFAPVAILYAFLNDGWLVRRIAVAGLVTLWSLRLGSYLFSRVRSHHPEEDRRYAALRDRWSENLGGAFLKFFLGQAMLVWLLMLPVFLITREAQVGFQIVEWIGLSVWLCALGGEALSDAQLKRFKKNNHDSKQVCQLGLWRYSRHPNYFFQSLLWWGLFLIALPAAWGWAAILAPLAMLYFLLRITGIPLTEQLAVESKGEAYKEYQRTTNAFVPWFPKTP
ncbi:MAG: steroid 5-alpha reductase family enzyme [Verrucomicrobiales bacterium]|jgi:steroid 5-alpha reductase family enzyme